MLIPDGYCWMFATYRLPPNFSGQCSSALEEEDRKVFFWPVPSRDHIYLDKYNTVQQCPRGKWTFQTYFSLLNISTLRCIFNLFAYLQYSTYPSLSNTYNLLLYRDVYTSFYQWVPPFLIASACLFYLPRFLHMTYITVSCNSTYRGSRMSYMTYITVSCLPRFTLSIYCNFICVCIRIRSIWLSLEDGLMNYFSTGTRER